MNMVIKVKEYIAKFWPLIGIIILLVNYNIFSGGNLTNRVLYVLAFPVFAFFCVYSSLKFEWMKKYDNLCAKTMFGISPFFLFWMMETLGGNQLPHIKFQFWIGNIIWYLVFVGITLILIRRIKYAIILSFLITYMVGLANYYVSKFRGVPILPWDIKSASTAMGVADNYNYGLSIYAIWATIMLFFFILTALKFENKKIVIRTKKSVIILGEYLIVFMLVLIIQNTVGILGLFGGEIYAWRQNLQYKTCGTVISFMENMRFLDIEKPEGYSTEEIKKLEESYQQPKEEQEVKPNIIAIMNECLADLTVVKDLHTNQDVMPFIHGLKENTIKGNLYVSVFGGNTCNTEFEFLTGSSMAFLPTGSIPYQQYIDEDTSSLCRTLATQGYECLAIHPNYAKNWSRDKVYPFIGFERFYDIKDFYNPTKIRDYVSDAGNYKKVKELFETRNKDNPLFLFNVTMQNHGGYSDYSIPKDIFFGESLKYWRTSVYLNLVKKTDEAFENLIHYFEEVEEPTIVMLFGDHQPGIYDGFYDEINAQTDQSVYKNKYIVPFVIWANYDIPEAEIDAISANYLSSLLLKTAELDMTPYNKFLLEARETIPAISANGYLDSEGVWHELEELTQEEYIAKMKRLQYNNLFDQKNKITSMFELDLVK